MQRGAVLVWVVAALVACAEGFQWTSSRFVLKPALSRRPPLALTFTPHATLPHRTSMRGAMGLSAYLRMQQAPVPQVPAEPPSQPPKREYTPPVPLPSVGLGKDQVQHAPVHTCLHVHTCLCIILH